MKYILTIAFVLASVHHTAMAKDLVAPGTDLYCLAQNIYYEARGSSRADKMAVAEVVLNRVRDNRYPNTVCEVVYQGKQKPSWKDPTKMVMVRNMCQFSWYCDGKKDKPPEGEAWKNAQWIAYEMMNQYPGVNITDGATHYHAHYVYPTWADKFIEKGRIGDHYFYKQK